MGVMKEYGLSDYKGGKTYEDFLEPGEKVMFISDKVSYVAFASASTSLGGNSRTRIEDQFIVTDLRLFVMQKERKVMFVKTPAWPIFEMVYDYDYAKKVIGYAKDALGRADAAGLDKGKALAEESQHRTKIHSIELLMRVRQEKSIFGAESLIFGELGISFGNRLGSGVLKALIGPSGKTADTFPFDVKKPLVAVSPEAKKYPSDQKYPNTGQCVAFLNEKAGEISKKVDDLKAMAQKLENL
ncbi:MAG: hypothetical protein M1279_01090 [Candidatus Marsarchaeota archaeon]|jgi:hypothetical protein|nr:hypothetical protein [Candidatus Marsarchaeota archaeon]